MWKFARENNLISEHQHGFVNKRSTQTQLLECGNYWTYWVSQKEGVDVVYLDISKAFDTVSHPKLMYKLKKLGFRGSLFSWLKDFLCGRTQKVKVNNNFSSPCNVKSGVPQGSVLGPLLFILYLNDIILTISTLTLPYSGFYLQILNLAIWRIGLESPILNSPLIIA